MTPTDAPLHGESVLIVEDRYMIASELAKEVEELGGQVLGPVKDIGSAADIIAGGEVQLALLDVNLDGELVFPIAEALSDRDVPFIFLTGYDLDVLPGHWRDRPSLSKPVDPKSLRDALQSLALPGA